MFTALHSLQLSAVIHAPDADPDYSLTTLLLLAGLAGWLSSRSSRDFFSVRSTTQSHRHRRTHTKPQHTAVSLTRRPMVSGKVHLSLMDGSGRSMSYGGVRGGRPSHLWVDYDALVCSSCGAVDGSDTATLSGRTRLKSVLAHARARARARAHGLWAPKRASAPASVCRPPTECPG